MRSKYAAQLRDRGFTPMPAALAQPLGHGVSKLLQVPERTPGTLLVPHFVVVTIARDELWDPWIVSGNVDLKSLGFNDYSGIIPRLMASGAV